MSITSFSPLSTFSEILEILQENDKVPFSEELNLKFGYGNVEIVSGGCAHGADKYAKKYALELECHYKEFNPSHTQKNFYSAMPDGFYDKQYNPKNFFHRNKFLAKYVDYLIAFIPEGIESKGTLHTIKQAKNFQKKVMI